MTPKLKSPLLPYSTWNCRWYDEKYDCARERACILRDNRMITILMNPRQVTLSLSRTRNDPMNQRSKAGNIIEQRHRAHEIRRRRCDSIQTRRCDCGMTRTTTITTRRRRRRKSCRVTTWLVPVHFCLFFQYTYDFNISIKKTRFSSPRRKDARNREWCWSAGTLSVPD